MSMFSLRNPSTLRLQTFRPDPAAHPGLHPHRPAGRERHQRQPERLKKTKKNKTPTESSGDSPSVREVTSIVVSHWVRNRWRWWLASSIFKINEHPSATSKLPAVDCSFLLTLMNVVLKKKAVKLFLFRTEI